METIAKTLVAVQPKSAWMSKRFWLNALSTAVGVLAVAQEVIPQIDAVYPLPDEWTKYILAASAIINIILLRTSGQPIRFRDAENKAVALPRA